MKHKNWSNFVVHCSGINEIMTNPRGVTDLTKSQRIKYDKLIIKPELTEKETESFAHFKEKIARFKDPELSMTAIAYLMRRYAYEKYGKRLIYAKPKRIMGFVKKGNELEMEAIAMLAKFDKTTYTKYEDTCNNEYIQGKCDILCSTTDKIVDVKVSWNINTFLPYSVRKLDRKYWYQMQAYLEIYDKDYGEVSFVLLNTPEYLVDRERIKLTERYVFGEINRERYDEEMENMEAFFDYDKIPLKRRIITFGIHRHQEVMSKIYRKVERCRDWLNEFELIHLSSKKIITLPEIYTAEATEEDSTEPDAPESYQIEQGG